MKHIKTYVQLDEDKGNEFKKWFDGSVVTKKDGKPLPVYHASIHKNHSHNYGKNIPVLFFCKDKNVAKYFGEHVDTAYLSIKKPIYFDDSVGQSWGYITLKDIKNISDEQRWEIVKYTQTKHSQNKKTKFKDLEDFYKNRGNYDLYINDVAEYAMKNWKDEFDGIVAKNIYEGDDDRFSTDDYIPFSAEQIRFA